MPRGKIPFKLYAVIARLDTQAMEAGNYYDDDYREPIKVDGDGDGIGEPIREELPEVRLRGGVERDREELQRLTRGGDVPDSAIGFFVHMRDMEKGDGVNSYVNPDGSLIFGRTDRLVRIEDKRGQVVNTFDSPQVFCTHAMRLQADIGGTSNGALLLFEDTRPKGVV